MHPSLEQVAHRPWPLPAAGWTWRQNWHDLLFAHWPIATSELRRLVPDRLTIQEFDGTSWVGVVPFRMTGVMRRPLPDLPWVSAFPELNLRLYVEYRGKPGVWFLSLDATNPLAVWAARRFFHLPYHRTRIDFRDDGTEIRFDAVRPGAMTFHASYRPISEPFHAQPGSLEQFLVERYCLYAMNPAGELSRTEVHHAPWPLQRATATVGPHELLAMQGLNVRGEPLLHFARRIDVVVWSPERLG